MTEMDPPRRRMVDAMTIRDMSPATRRSRLDAVTGFGRQFGGSPERLDLEDARAFRVRPVATGISWPAPNQTVRALRFFRGATPGHAEIPERRRVFDIVPDPRVAAPVPKLVFSRRDSKGPNERGLPVKVRVHAHLPERVTHRRQLRT